MHRLRAFLRRHPILRRILAVAIIPVILAVGVAVALLWASLPETVPPGEIGFQTLDANAAVRITNYTDAWRGAGFELSADRRWLAMRVPAYEPAGQWGDGWLFFDLERNRYVASLEGLTKDRKVDFMLRAEWTPNDLPVIWTTDDPRPPSWFRQWVHRVLRRPLSKTKGRRSTFSLANIPASKARLYFSEPLPDQQSRLFAVPNRSRTAVYAYAYSPGPPNSGSGGTVEHRVYDLRLGRGGRVRVLEDVSAMIGWMDDDRTLIVRSKGGLRLIDAWRDGLVRDIPIHEPLAQLQNEGKLGPGRIWPFLGEEKRLPRDRLRFMLSLRSFDASRRHFDRLSLWDVDLRTGALSHVMDLDWCEPYLFRDPVFLAARIIDLVYSPSGDRVVAPVSTSTLVTSSIGTSLTLAIASPGQPPRILPIRVPRFFSTDSTPYGHIGDASPSPLSSHMAFLDENTLIYRGAGDTLWRYDLRTSAPECIWTPWEGKEAPAAVAGRLVDTRGRAVADRLVMIAHKDKPLRSLNHCLVAYSKTDRGGRFRFNDVSPGTYTLAVQPYPGYGLYVAQRPEGGAFVLQPGRRVSGLDCCTEAPEDRGDIAGRVIDAESGEPIDEFACQITGVDLPGEITPVLGLGLMKGKLNPLGASSWTDGEFVQGLDGAFRIEGISPGTATLEISKAGYALERVPLKIESGRTIERTFRLEREGFLTGRVTLDGRPCGYCQVDLWFLGDRFGKPQYARADADGVFRYRALKPGEYKVRFIPRLRAGGVSVSLAEMLRARVESGTTATLNFDFGRDDRNAALRGSFSGPKKDYRWNVIVLDASATAAGLSVDERLRGGAWYIHKTGNYSIDHLTPGPYEVVGRCTREEEYRREGHIPVASLVTTKTVTLSAGETAVVDFDLK